MEVDTPPGNTPPTAGPIDVVFSPALPFGGLAHDPPPVPANLIPNNPLSLTIPSSWSGRDLLAAIRHHYVEFTSIRNIRRVGLVRCGDSDRSSMEDVTLSVIIGSLLVTDNTPNIAEHIPHATSILVQVYFHPSSGLIDLNGDPIEQTIDGSSQAATTTASPSGSAPHQHHASYAAAAAPSSNSNSGAAAVSTNPPPVSQATATPPSNPDAPVPP